VEHDEETGTSHTAKKNCHTHAEDDKSRKGILLALGDKHKQRMATQRIEIYNNILEQHNYSQPTGGRYM
jgi:hypothetical protein